MICNNCGKKIKKTDNFCPSCGAVLPITMRDNNTTSNTTRNKPIFAIISSILCLLPIFIMFYVYRLYIISLSFAGVIVFSILCILFSVFCILSIKTMYPSIILAVFCIFMSFSNTYPFLFVIITAVSILYIISLFMFQRVGLVFSLISGIGFIIASIIQFVLLSVMDMYISTGNIIISFIGMALSLLSFGEFNYIKKKIKS